MVQLVDDQILGSVLRGDPPPEPDLPVFTTGYWYVRLCQAVLGAHSRPGALSRPFAILPPELRRRAMQAVLELPDAIGLESLRHLGPLIGELRQRHSLNALGIEVLAAAIRLDATVWLSSPAPRLQDALAAEGRPVRVRA